MSTFPHTHWLLVGKNADAREWLQKHFQRYEGCRLEEDVRCSNGSRVVVQNAWRVDSEEELEAALRHFVFDFSEVEAFIRLPGQTDAEEWSLESSIGVVAESA